ncbi:MAG TPA: hypothetical protein VF723_08400 [Pyrinomonadaceae bacterium]|jgi:hypothetical protein
MQRLNLYTGITLLALVLGGWSGVLAVAFCSHSGGNLPAGEHSCCRAEAAAPEGETHCSVAQHEAMPSAQMMHGDAAESVAALSAAFHGQTESCGHCVSRNELPSAPARERELAGSRRAEAAPATVSLTPPAALALAPVRLFIPTQHSPPAVSGRRNLLFGVFLI